MAQLVSCSQVGSQGVSAFVRACRAFLAKGLVLKGAGKTADAQRSFLQARYLAPPEARAAVDDLAER